MIRRNSYSTQAFVIALLAFAVAAEAQGQDKKKKEDPKAPAAPAAASTSPGGSGAEEVNVEAIKEKYWARGEESEMGVVQNRLYSKERKFEFGLFGGFITSDPFLSINSVGGSLGYHFNEYLSVHLLGWKHFVGGSAAFTGFQDLIQRGGGAATVPDANYPKAYYGSELSASLLYGKLSLVGKAIIYYDLHVLGGLGVTDTEYAMLFTPHVGLGQQFYLNKWSTLRFDYRIMYYQEKLLRKPSPQDQGELVDGGQVSNESRSNWSHAITLGVSFFFGI